MRRGLSGDDLDSVSEFHSCDQLWQVVVAIEATPAFLCGLDQLEHHRERGLAGEAALRSDRAVSHRSESAFDRIRNRYEDGGAFFPAAIGMTAAYGATIRDRGAGSTKVRAGRRVR